MTKQEQKQFIHKQKQDKLCQTSRNNFSKQLGLKLTYQQKASFETINQESFTQHIVNQINQLHPKQKGQNMFGSPCFMDSPSLKPEEDLYNISFFQPNKSYDLLSMHQPKHKHRHEFSSWSDKDQQFFQFNYRSRKEELIRKQTADSKLKRTSHQKLRISYSVTFHPNKVDLRSRMPESPQKFPLKTKSQSIFVQSQSNKSSELKKYLENKSQVVEKSKEKSKLIQRLRQRMLEQDTKRAIELETQPSYNVINYPITTVIRKRKYKKMDKFPFPSLAYRLNK